MPEAVDRHQRAVFPTCPPQFCLKYSPELVPAKRMPSSFVEWCFRLSLERHMEGRLFQSLIGCCKRKGAFEFETHLFPVYLILKKYCSVYPELSPLIAAYSGNCVRLRAGGWGTA